MTVKELLKDIDESEKIIIHARISNKCTQKLFPISKDLLAVSKVRLCTIHKWYWYDGVINIIYNCQVNNMTKRRRNNV